MVDGPVRRVWAASKPHCKYWDRTAKARNVPFIWVIRLNGPKPGLKLVKNWYDINHDKTIWSDLVRWMWSKSNKYKLNWPHKLLKKNKVPGFTPDGFLKKGHNEMEPDAPTS